ncbi:hypothetical protein [Chryseosolibacter indicus]|uniref:Uncharacterized protein n=1 Tax=Chryseosolibacter indicus TaxID=2782351 RepID=A0ABS5VW94_9BACT|nr:hypothetical protein [Chryseosolibacter indicus]MBT1705700.1 hypothetical protein [Chryseosolibacter indicus]
MKYQLTSTKPNNNTEILLENITPAKTKHIRGYGLGVTFSGNYSAWKHNATIGSLKMLTYSEATVICQA